MKRAFRALIAAGLVTAAMFAPVAATAEESFSDDFESGTLSGWTVTTGGNGTATVADGLGTGGSRAARLTVPEYGTNSIAYLRRAVEPAYGLFAEANVKVLSGGCDPSAGYSYGSVPFFRFFDTAGIRRVGVYRINGSNCGGNTKLYVQHSGNFVRANTNIRLGTWYKLGLRATVEQPGQATVEVFVDGVRQFATTVADNGLKPFGSVTMHNEHADQVGDLLVDDVRVTTFGVTPPTSPCAAGTPAPANESPGTALVADNFESFSFDQWTTTNLSGDAVAQIQTDVVHAGSCAARLTVTSAPSSRANLDKRFAQRAQVWSDAWVNVRGEGASSSNVPLLRLFSSGSRIVDVYRANGSGELWLRTPNGTGGFVYSKLPRVLTLNTWYRIQVHAAADGGAGSVAVSVDGVPLTPATPPGPLGVAGFTGAMVGSEHFSQAMDLVMDDAVIAVS